MSVRYNTNFCLNYVSFHVYKNIKPLCTTVDVIVRVISYVYLALFSEKNASACHFYRKKFPNHIYFLFSSKQNSGCAFPLNPRRECEMSSGNSVMFADISVSYRVSPRTPRKARWWNKHVDPWSLAPTSFYRAFVYCACYVYFVLLSTGIDYSWHGSNESLSRLVWYVRVRWLRKKKKKQRKRERERVAAMGRERDRV